MTVLLPHAPEVRPAWDDDGVEVKSFRYAPASWELLGYSRSLQADETMKLGAAAVTPLYLRGAHAAVRRELATGTYDLLQAHWVVPNGLVGLLSSAKIPLAIGLHGSDVFLAERFGLRQMVRRVLAKTRVMTGCSPELVSRVAALGLVEERTRVIPYGVDIEAFSPAPERRGIWRQKLGIPDEAPLVISVGRMATKKGYQVLLDVLPQLLDERKDVHVALAGAGDRLEEFRRRTAPFRERVHFPGSIERGTLPDFYRAADVFTLPAVHDPKGNVDGLPNVILEAMATALPVIATHISGIPLAIDDGQQGFLIPEQSPEALLDALHRALADPDAARAMGARARERVEAQLTWDAVAARYRDAYSLAWD